MFQIKTLLVNHWSTIKYVLFAVLLFSMIIAIRTYINYVTIIDTINNVTKRKDMVQEELDYSQNFQSRYLASEYGHLFLAHDNNMLFWGDSIVSFRSWSEVVSQPATMSITHIPNRRQEEEISKTLLRPQESRQMFIREKLGK